MQVWQVQVDEDYLYSCSVDRTIRKWRIEVVHIISKIFPTFIKDGECIQTLSGHEGPVRCLNVAKEFVASGSGDATIRLWSKVGSY